MIPLESTANPSMTFNPSIGENSKKINIPTNKIGWLHSIADTPGAKFDLIIKDGIGRVKFQRKNCGNDTDKYGELVNLPTMMGEQLEVIVENLQGAKKVDILLN